MKWRSGNSVRELRKLLENLSFGRTDFLFLILAVGSMYALANEAEPWGVALIVIIFMMVPGVQAVWRVYAAERAARKRLHLSSDRHRTTIQQQVEQESRAEQELPFGDSERMAHPGDEEGTDGV